MWCCHCGIRFFTHPRNAGRLNLRCPFGCRVHHRRQLANQRSRRHYQRPEGRRNKKRLNGKRSKSNTDRANALPGDDDASSASLGQPAQLRPQEEPADSAHAICSDTESVDSILSTECIASTDSLSESVAQEVRELITSAENLTLPLDGFVLDEATLLNSPVLPYARMVASVMEGRKISREELLAALRKRMRQRSIDRLPRREYVLRYLHEHPP